MKKLWSVILLVGVVISSLPLVGASQTVVGDLPLYGDLNEDGDVNAKDALVVLAYSVGKFTPQQRVEEFILLADVDENGSVTAGDALEILKFSVEKPARFPDRLLVSSKTLVELGTVATADYLETNNKAYLSSFESLAVRQGIGTYVRPLGEEFLVDTLVNNAKAGKSTVDLLEVSPAVVFKAAKQNAIANVKGSKTLDLSLFHNRATEFMTLGDTLYGVASKATVDTPLLFFYNRDLAEQVAPETNVAQLVKERKWNISAFREFLNKAKLVNEDNRTVRCGFTGGSETIVQLMLATGGPIAYGEQGKVTANGLKDRFHQAIDFSLKLFKTDRTWKYLKDEESRIASFQQGQSMGLFAGADKAQSLANGVDFSLGIAPLPLGENQTEYASVHSAPRVYAVPKDKENRLDLIGKWLNATAKGFGKHRNNQIVTLLRVDPKSEAGTWYGELLENACLDYANGAITANITSQIQSILLTKKPYNVLPAIQAQLNKELDDFYAPLYE